MKSSQINFYILPEELERLNEYIKEFGLIIIGQPIF